MYHLYRILTTIACMLIDFVLLALAAAVVQNYFAAIGIPLGFYVYTLIFWLAYISHILYKGHPGVIKPYSLREVKKIFTQYANTRMIQIIKCSILMLAIEFLLLFRLFM